MGLLDNPDNRQLLMAGLLDSFNAAVPSPGGRGFGNQPMSSVDRVMQQRRQAEMQAEREQAAQYRQWQMQQQQAKAAAEADIRAKQDAYIASLPPGEREKAGAFRQQFGQSLYSAPSATSKMQEYEMAKGQGYAGSFMDYQRETKAPLVQIGAEGWKPEAGMMKDPNNPNRMIRVEGGSVDRKVKQEQAILDNVIDSIEQYENMLEKYGTEVMPGTGKAELGSAYTTMQLDLKDLFEMGTLQAGDLEMIEAVAADPTALDSVLKSNAQFTVPLKNLKNRIKRKKAIFTGETNEEKANDLEARARKLGITP